GRRVAGGGVAEAELAPRRGVDRFTGPKPAYRDDLVAVDARLLPFRHLGCEETRVEAERRFLRRDPMCEVDEPVGCQSQPFGPEHRPKRLLVRVAGAAVRLEPRGIGPKRATRKQAPGLLKRLADPPKPVGDPTRG